MALGKIDSASPFMQRCESAGTARAQIAALSRGSRHERSVRRSSAGPEGLGDETATDKPESPNGF